MTKFRDFRARVCIVGGDVETLWDISDESRKFRECCRYLRGKRVRVTAFDDVVSTSETTFWTIWGRLMMICEDWNKFGDGKRKGETFYDVSNQVWTNLGQFDEVLEHL